MRVTPFSVVAAALALGCRPPADGAAARAAIDARNATWARFTAAGQADSIAQHYHPNAVLLPPNMSPVRGLDSIRAFFATLNTMSSPPPTLDLHADSVWAGGGWAVELGRWTFTWAAGATRPPGAPAVDSGRYLVRWVNEGGQWLMVQDIWNSALPAAGMSGAQ